MLSILMVFAPICFLDAAIGSSVIGRRIARITARLTYWTALVFSRDSVRRIERAESAPLPAANSAAHSAARPADRGTASVVPPVANRAPARSARRLPAGHGSSDALQLARLVSGGGQMLHVIVCAHTTDCPRLIAEIGYFAPDLRVGGLPDWEILPYDHLSPHQDLVSERLSALYALLSRKLDVLVVAATTAAHRLAPPSFLAARTSTSGRVSRSTSMVFARS
jgi:hypothetical protein